MCEDYVHMVYIYIMSLIYDRIFCKKHQNGPRNVTEPHLRMAFVALYRDLVALLWDT